LGKEAGRLQETFLLHLENLQAADNFLLLSEGFGQGVTGPGLAHGFVDQTPTDQGEKKHP
jgi:hypothetical protein